MAKTLSTILFLVAFLFSGLIYLNRDTKTLRENLEQDDTSDPRVQIENFILYRYNGAKLSSELRAKSGEFVDPNSAALVGAVRAVNYTETGEETVEAEQALAIYDAENLGATLSGAELARTKLIDSVVVQYSQHTMYTDYAEYIARKSVIVSDRPVEVRGPGRWFKGQAGFQVDLSDSTVELFGRINGEGNIDKSKN